MKTDFESIKGFDQENDIDIYILNNDISDIADIYQAFGKKVICLFHGIFLSSIFQNKTKNYLSWKNINKFDAFIYIIPDDYWVYKKFGFNNTIYIPYMDFFKNKNIPSLPLNNKDILTFNKW